MILEDHSSRLIHRKCYFYGLSPIGCHNIHRTNVTANNSTNNNVVFFVV